MTRFARVEEEGKCLVADVCLGIPSEVVTLRTDRLSGASTFE